MVAYPSGNERNLFRLVPVFDITLKPCVSVKSPTSTNKCPHFLQARGPVASVRTRELQSGDKSVLTQNGT